MITVDKKKLIEVYESGKDVSELLKVAEQIEEATKMRTYLKAVEDCAKIVQVHKEGEELSYCDTGADMEMGCRSECVHMALDRLREHYKSLKQTNDHEPDK